jgi:hypothetical protein
MEIQMLRPWNQCLRCSRTPKQDNNPLKRNGKAYPHSERAVLNNSDIKNWKIITDEWASTLTLIGLGGDSALHQK